MTRKRFVGLGCIMTLVIGMTEAKGQTSNPDSVVIRGLSWDIMGGGIPSGGALTQLEFGFSSLPRVAYHHTIEPGLSIGGLVSLDVGHWAPSAAIATSLLAGVPVRYQLFKDEEWTIGVRGDPGLRIGFAGGTSFGVHIGVAANAGYSIENRFLLGAGIDMPMLLDIPTSNGSTTFSAPILIGPWFEAHLSPPLAVTVEVKMGPHLNTADVTFALRAQLGLAYRL